MVARKLVKLVKTLRTATDWDNPQIPKKIAALKAALPKLQAYLEKESRLKSWKAYNPSASDTMWNGLGASASFSCKGEHGFWTISLHLNVDGELYVQAKGPYDDRALGIGKYKEADLRNPAKVLRGAFPEAMSKSAKERIASYPVKRSGSIIGDKLVLTATVTIEDEVTLDSILQPILHDLEDFVVTVSTGEEGDQYERKTRGTNWTTTSEGLTATRTIYDIGRDEAEKWLTEWKRMR